MTTTTPVDPVEEARILARAQRFAGWTLAEVAREVGVPLPSDPTRAKGAIGILVERALGAEAGSRPAPDFDVGIELKTIPIDARGRPAESTFVTMVSRIDLERDWVDSHVRAKLARVLFVPVESRDVRPFAERRIGWSFAWSPSEEEEAILAADWAHLASMTLLYGDIRAQHGEALQIRPKGKNASDTTRRHDEDGAPVRVLKRGFYLRAPFTTRILERSGLAR